MAMLTKTFRDILDIIGSYSDNLSRHLNECSRDSAGRRESLLLTYFSDRANRLSEEIETLMEVIDEKELGTWFYEYTDRHSVVHVDPRSIDFRKLRTGEIQAEVVSINEGIIDLVRHVNERAENNTLKQVLDGILIKLIAFSKETSAGAEAIHDL